MDSNLQELLNDFQQGFLTRRGFMAKASALGLTAAAALGLISGAATGIAEAQAPAVQPKRWQRGKGWGPVWGSGDTRGVLNELSPELTKKALALAKQGKVYDLGLSYDRRSYKWPGHSPGEILTFRSQHGEFSQKILTSSSIPKRTGSKPVSPAARCSFRTTSPRNWTASVTSPSGPETTPCTTTATRPVTLSATGDFRK